MTHLFLVSLFVIYLSIAPCLFASWFAFYQQEAGRLSAEEKQLSLLTLAIASVLWPIVVPIAYLNQLSKAKQTLQKQSKLTPVVSVRTAHS